MNEEKMTLKESVRLTLRAWRFYWKNTPRFVLSTVLWALADAVSPYAVVWFSARLVAELSDARDPQALAVDVAWVLGVTALLTLVRSVLLHWKSVEREQLNWQLGHDCFMEKQMSMDYADEDSQQVYDLYNFIQQSESFCSGGNPNAVALLDSVSAAVHGQGARWPADSIQQPALCSGSAGADPSRGVALAGVRFQRGHQQPGYRGGGPLGQPALGLPHGGMSGRQKGAGCADVRPVRVFERSRRRLHACL